MEYQFLVLTGMVIVFTMYLYGALDAVRDKLITVIDYGFIRPHYAITRTASHILAYLVFATPIVLTFTGCYGQPYYYWKTIFIMVIMATAFAFTCISVSLFLTKLWFNNKTVILNWIALAGVLFLYTVYAIAPAF